VQEGLKLDNLRTDHVMIRSELKYLNCVKIVDLKCRVFGGKHAPFPTVQVFRVVRPIATVWFRVEPNPELTREFGPVAYTTQDAKLKIHDAPLTLILRMRQGACRCLFCIYKLPTY
jgi:hypothetical protein